MLSTAHGRAVHPACSRTKGKTRVGTTRRWAAGVAAASRTSMSEDRRVVIVRVPTAPGGTEQGAPSAGPNANDEGGMAAELIGFRAISRVKLATAGNAPSTLEARTELDSDVVNVPRCSALRGVLGGAIQDVERTRDFPNPGPMIQVPG
ncbi:hypothetical protein GLOTRDRAFT_91799 [Gloeophyllum trabeum ATCC 11539]|uniref:Uncharacterized protein n=1 Tax=Gloeophyllum trabeum (strain ATCC 11539 / FP-39264 / Madison 617) TaxID=670483 RepID=S7QEX3_GLOTA|nr:uncharacterized protein GLOTRDRAFT_91799 [Gloeophyllum trabeum ATCC 11539]EPQ58371.1 hypothetical protein GLOTRDRAFT_91799 [Gloeophyllum trabeum ATCC 11539]